MAQFRVPFISKEILALILTLSISGYLLFSRTSPQVQKLKFQVSWVAGKIAYPKTWYNNILAVKEKNRLLKNEIAQLSLLNSQLESYRIENNRLKKMLNFSETQPLSMMTANVVNQNFGLSAQSITIDLGRNEGIITNLPILDEYGLLGKTIQIGDGAALVQLITDKNYRVSIRVGVDRTLGIFFPTHGKYGILEGIRKSMPLKNGEIAFTSGISEIYPPNIPVAQVISTNIDNNRPFQDVVVELLGQLDNLNYVFIIQ